MKKWIAILALLTNATLADAASAQPGYAVGAYSLSLDGVPSGYLNSVEGGAITAEVNHQSQGDQESAKSLGAIKYEPLAIKTDFSSMDPALYAWISDSWKGRIRSKNVAVITLDKNLRAKSQREFFNALITETTIPACDATAKEAGHLAVKFAPEYTLMSEVSGMSSIQSGSGSRKGESKAFQFQLKIDGLDCNQVVRIESFTVRQASTESVTGQYRVDTKETGRFEFPNLKVTLGAASAQTWRQWFESFVIEGRNGDKDEKQGTLEFLSPRMEVIAAIRFTGLGIFRLEEPGNQANVDAMARYTAELYCEGMSLGAAGGD